MRAFRIAAVLLTITFATPLLGLFRLALEMGIQSHILLIPFVFLYLFKTAPKAARTEPFRSSIWASLCAALTGFAGLLAWWYFGRHGQLTPNDTLSLSTFSFLALFFAIALVTIGWPALRPYLFAITFLVFMIPLPLVAIDFLSLMLQRASAEAADLLLSLTGMPVLRDGFVFQFPGLLIRVAEECSGVRSTLVLFITSLLASHLFLRTGWKKALLTLAILPLGILRNAFRITVISWLTVNVDGTIIHGPLHHKGGPIFFILSLLPLLALLWILRRSDFHQPVVPNPSVVPPSSSANQAGQAQFRRTDLQMPP